MSGVVFVTCVIAVLVVYTIYKLLERAKYMKLIWKIPGPEPLPFVGNALDFRAPPDIIFEKLEKYWKQYYPIYRLSGGFHAVVFLSSPEDVETILSGMKHLAKSNMYETLHFWLNTGLLTSTDKKWQTRRKILTPSFHFNILQGFTATFIEKSEQLAKELEGLVDQELDIVPIATKYTFLTICETAMGTNAEDEKTEQYKIAIYKMGTLTVHRITSPWYHHILPYMTSPKFYQSLYTCRYLHQISRNIIEKRKASFNVDDIPVENEEAVYKGKKRLAMLDMLLYAKSIGADIDDNGIREEVDTFTFEGHDTTTNSLSFTLMLLACNKDIQDKAFAELTELLPNKDDRLTYDILNNMKYLERVIKESLRLYPSVPMFGRITSEWVKTSTGHMIPPDTNVMIRPYDIHRDPRLYPDPEKFDPDRFLPENSKHRHTYAYIPFSAGPRNCIGQKFAFLEMKAFLSGVLRNFEILPIDNPQTIRLVADLTLHAKGPIRMKLRRRSSSTTCL